MNFVKTCFIALPVIILGSFATAQEPEEEERSNADETEERVCVNSRSIRTFDAISDEYVYVREGSNGHYLMTTQNRCFNLRHAQGIALKDATSRICSDGFGEIVYRNGLGSAARLESCRIDKIERVDSRDDAKAIVEARKAAEDE